MPGQIKIDDGAGNYTILTNAGSLGSDKTITIPNTTGTMALTSDVPAGNPAFSVYDNWFLTANLTTAASPITANLSRFTDGTTTNIGDAMTVSSGIFTFPSTGIYQVTAMGSASQNTNSVNAQLYIRTTNDNFASNDVIVAYAVYNSGSTSNLQRTQQITVLVDVQDTTTHKVKFQWSGFSSGHFTLFGAAADLRTGFQFIKVADT